MEQILITGGRGMLGSALIPRLIAAGHVVRSASRGLPRATADTRVEWTQIDLAMDDGIAETVAGKDVIIHAASAGQGDSYRVDVEGTRRLLAAAKAAGVKHLLFISIVAVEQIDAPYLRHKLAAERLIAESGVPYSILRAAQFHSLLDIFLTMLTRLPIAPVDPAWRLQPIDEGEVADRMVEMVAAGPAGRVPDIAGPEVRTMRDLTRRWLAVRGLKRVILWVPFPGQPWKAFRQGLPTLPGEPHGRITWEQWLASKYDGQPATPVRQTQRVSRA